MTSSERVQELIVWSETAGVQPFTIEDIRRNVFERIFREFVEWADEHPEVFNVEDQINI